MKDLLHRSIKKIELITAILHEISIMYAKVNFKFLTKNIFPLCTIYRAYYRSMVYVSYKYRTLRSPRSLGINL